jgi:hypothetical protein
MTSVFAADNHSQRAWEGWVPPLHQPTRPENQGIAEFHPPNRVRALDPGEPISAASLTLQRTTATGRQNAPGGRRLIGRT